MAMCDVILERKMFKFHLANFLVQKGVWETDFPLKSATALRLGPSAAPSDSSRWTLDSSYKFQEQGSPDLSFLLLYCPNDHILQIYALTNLQVHTDTLRFKIQRSSE